MAGWADGASWARVITGLAAHGIKAVAAPLTDLFFRTEPHPQAPKLAPDNANLLWLPDYAFAKAFAQNASAEDLTVLKATQRPLRFSCMTVPTVGPVLWRKVPSGYLVAEHDHMIVPATQRFMAERMRAKIKPHSLSGMFSLNGAAGETLFRPNSTGHLS